MIRFSEAVLPGHPDKFCDLVADAIVQVRLTHQTQHFHFIVCCREIERTVNIGVGRAGNQIAS